MENLPAPKQLTRRDSLKWLGVLTAGLTLPLISGCESIAISTAKLAGKWPELNLEPITGEGYGTDPNLVSPPDSPWPLTMTPAQRALVGRVADILIPREGSTPSASEVGVPDVLDEWISAPYPSFQADRVELLSGLAWIDQESQRRFGHVFVEIFEQQQLEIIEDIAYEESKSNLRYVYMANVFDGLRALITIAFFSTPEGIRDLGYQGNVPIVGDYPGPTTEAMNHLDGLLQELGLGEHTYS
ncbi:MAG: gluconate 2-dehydrogenase subunit 3 family protein [Halieaceae bacterium]|nr:gluconate 2-dehydrogenase subunit 3 family protein [Halieaceae bacterium]